MTVIYGILDFGLGHATRSIPIIKLLSQKHKVVIVASGRSYNWLKIYFSDSYKNIEIIKIPALKITYTKISLLFELKFILEIGKLFINYLIDRYFIHKLVIKYHPQFIISDNRFGIWYKYSKNIFISHQLKIKMPKFLRWLENFVFKMNSYFIEHFDEVWVPDLENEELSLTGELSHSLKPKIPVYYIGLLSRFYEFKNSVNCKNYSIVASISGPEPNRSILVKKLINTLKHFNKPVLIIAGLPEKIFEQKINNIKVINNLQDNLYACYIKQAQFVIVRAGYSTIMDLIALKKTAIIIPTPHQTEQIYITSRLSKYFIPADENSNLLNLILSANSKLQTLQNNINSLSNAFFPNYLPARKSTIFNQLFF